VSSNHFAVGADEAARPRRALLLDLDVDVVAGGCADAADGGDAGLAMTVAVPLVAVSTPSEPLARKQPAPQDRRVKNAAELRRTWCAILGLNQ
jgi:hypothetical protein